MKRLDPDLPFWYWTANERYREEQPGFDEDDRDIAEHAYQEAGQNAPRLHRVVRNAREDASIITGGRCFLPARNKPHLRQRMYRPEAMLPPVLGANAQHLPRV